MNQAFLAHFRCPDSVVDFRLGGTPPKESGYFRFGEGVDCYGQVCGDPPAANYRIHLEDVSRLVKFDDHQIALPFDPDQIVDNLRCESYTGQMRAERTHFGGKAMIRAMFIWAGRRFPLILEEYCSECVYREGLTHRFRIGL
jgi:hypothetical protein